MLLEDSLREAVSTAQVINVKMDLIPILSERYAVMTQYDKECNDYASLSSENGKSSHFSILYSKYQRAAEQFLKAIDTNLTIGIYETITPNIQHSEIPHHTPRGDFKPIPVAERVYIYSFFFLNVNTKIPRILFFNMVE